MDTTRLKLKGKIHQDAATLEKFSRDMSAYRIPPALVVEPQDETDVLNTLAFARNEGLSIVSRSGGSDLSGASVGPGIVLNFKKYMNRALNIGEKTVVQPGLVLAELLGQLDAKGLMHPATPSSSPICALGGNVGTRATGPKTTKYGTIDDFVVSLRFVSARGEVVDTAERLPDVMAEGLEGIQRRYLSDKKARAAIARRPYIAGGYNLKAFERTSDPARLADHLLVGSIGTLGIVTEIRLRSIPKRTSQGTLAAHFRNYDEFTDAALLLKALNPAALEYSDASCCRHVDGKILNLADPDIAATLVVEFDDTLETAREARDIMRRYDISRLWDIRSGSDEEAALWQDRRQILPALMKYSRRNNLLLPGIIDDIAIHTEYFGPVIEDLSTLMRQLGVEISFYGHAGFGSIHARPFFEANRSDLKELIETVSRESFKVLQKYNGTLVGEHNAGRSRSIYLPEDMGAAYPYLQDIKRLFDPEDILNPGVLFDTGPITQHMDFSVR